MLRPSPIALFAWQRPEHTEKSLASLAANDEAIDTELLIFIDGPRNRREATLTSAVRDVAMAASGFKSVSVQASPSNMGLSRSITGGVTQVLRQSETVIVVEDDIVVSRSFLKYMNDSLELYEGDPEVASIHGYVYPHDEATPATFFIAGADCWGWATWRRAWEHYRSDGRALRDELLARDLVSTFDFDGSANYFAMLEDQINGRNDSWAIRWYASALLDGMVTLYPNRPVAMNIGSDGSGSHGGISTAYDVELCHDNVETCRIAIQDSLQGRRAFTEFFAAQKTASGNSTVGRLVRGVLRPAWTRLPPDLRFRAARQWRG